MFCSTIIPTINRSTLDRAVNSVLMQQFTAADFEVIVVNDSGRPLSPAEWQQSDRVRIINTQRRRLSVARNTGAAIARGRYLHFLDDDDWLVSGAFQTFWTLAQSHQEAVWLYGGARFVDEAGNCLGEINLEMSGNCYIQLVAGSWIPAQVSFLQAKAFFDVGGFNPLFGPTEETELGRRIALRGDFVHTPVVVAHILRGNSWRTTVNYGTAPDYNRWSRDIALSEPGAFARMRSSAISSYWYGRMFHAYLTAALWNWRHKRLFKTSSRIMFALMSLAVARHHILSTEFWQAIRDTQVPTSEARTLEV